MINNNVYKYFASLVFKETGIYYSEDDFYRLDSRITKLMEKYECSTPEDLHRKYICEKTLDMEKYLIDICTNNETYFFRDNKPFTALTKDILPEFKLSKPNEKLKIWSCASSTGQEPLSIAMSFNELGWGNFNIKATDISSQALSKASSGIYTGLDVQRGLPITHLVKYFDSREHGDWAVKPDLLGHIDYSRFNLFTDYFPLNSYHIIFCRNVLLYQNQENKNIILDKLASSLQPGGYLVLGAGESLIGTNTGLEQKSLSNCMLFQKPLLTKQIA